MTKRPQLRTVVLYVTVSALWIWFSDHALNALVEGRAELAFLQSIKGWFFVLGTGALFLGVRPRVASVAAYGIVAYSFLVSLVGAIVKGQDWGWGQHNYVRLDPAHEPAHVLTVRRTR